MSREDPVTDITPSGNRFSVACADGKVSNGCIVGAFTTALIAMASSTGTNLSRFMVGDKGAGLALMMKQYRRCSFAPMACQRFRLAKATACSWLGFSKQSATDQYGS